MSTSAARRSSLLHQGIHPSADRDLGQGNADASQLPLTELFIQARLRASRNARRCGVIAASWNHRQTGTSSARRLPGVRRLSALGKATRRSAVHVDTTGTKLCRSGLPSPPRRVGSAEGVGGDPCREGYGAAVSDSAGDGELVSRLGGQYDAAPQRWHTSLRGRGAAHGGREVRKVDEFVAGFPFPGFGTAIHLTGRLFNSRSQHALRSLSKQI